MKMKILNNRIMKLIKTSNYSNKINNNYKNNSHLKVIVKVQVKKVFKMIPQIK